MTALTAGLLGDLVFAPAWPRSGRPTPGYDAAIPVDLVTASGSGLELNLALDGVPR